jgi:hypothetical protein
MANKVSILMLTHNAPNYVDTAMRSLAKNTKNVDYELIVVDNASELPTKQVVQQFVNSGVVRQAEFLNYNSLFAAGNNIAAGLASSDATHFLLLNSDVEIRHPDWLRNLFAVHKPGITAYGVVENPRRVDGYCLLVDAAIYLKHKLDEAHQWWWSITKFQAIVLAEGYSVQGYGKHEKYLHHFGGKSGNAFQVASGMDVTQEQVNGWFQARTIHVLDARFDGPIPARNPRSLLRRGLNKLRRLGD